MVTHIEFYGLPGCGKSTVARAIAEKAKALQCTVLQPSAQTGSEMMPLLRRMVKLTKAMGYIAKHPQQLRRIYQIVTENQYFKPAEKIKQMINITQKLSVYNQCREDAIYIWDEGLVQAAISLAIQADCSSTKNEQSLLHLCKHTPKMIRIYIEVPCEVALQRMAQRASNDSRVEKLANIADQREMLKRFEMACNQMDAQIHIIGDDAKPETIIDTVKDALFPILYQNREMSA